MRVIVLLFLVCSIPCYGQNYFRDHFGGSIGISMAIGSHQSQLGVTVNGFYTDHFYQVNLGSRFLFVPNSYGGRKQFWENRSTAGLILIAGEDDRAIDFELDGLNHQTNKSYGIGYNYVWYFDGSGTSQTAGGFGVHIKEFALYHENDLFGGFGRDRFRTGQFHFSYQYNKHKFTAGIQLWTGESKTAPLIEQGCDDCTSGYRDLRKTKFGKTSHGIFYLGWRHDFGFNQSTTARIGADAERIRHIFQNKLIHDLGAFLNRPTPHYPMLDENGLPTFDLSEIRQPIPYFVVGMNTDWAY